MGTLLQLAIAARQKISEPAHWTKNARHRSYGDGAVDAYCAIGAIEAAAKLRVSMAEDHQVGKRLIVELASDVRDKYALRADQESFVSLCAKKVMNFNDHGTHRKVLGLFDRTINRLKKRAEIRRQKLLARKIMREALRGAKQAKSPAEIENV